MKMGRDEIDMVEYCHIFRERHYHAFGRLSASPDQSWFHLYSRDGDGCPFYRRPINAERKFHTFSFSGARIAEAFEHFAGVCDREVRACSGTNWEHADAARSLLLTINAEIKKRGEITDYEMGDVNAHVESEGDMRVPFVTLTFASGDRVTLALSGGKSTWLDQRLWFRDAWKCLTVESPSVNKGGGGEAA